MARTPNTAQHLPIARKFIDKFGFNKVAVDEFDMFIIDNGLAVDPGNSETKDNSYKGFVQSRTAARNILNTAGTMLNGTSFQIVVEEAGKKYSVVPWAVNGREVGKELANRISKFTTGRVSEVKSVHNKAEKLLESGELSEEEVADVQLTHAMLTEMRMQAIHMQAKVKGLVTQYNTAMDALEDRLSKIVRNHPSLPESVE